MKLGRLGKLVGLGGGGVLVWQTLARFYYFDYLYEHVIRPPFTSEAHEGRWLLTLTLLIMTVLLVVQWPFWRWILRRGGAGTKAIESARVAAIEEGKKIGISEESSQWQAFAPARDALETIRKKLEVDVDPPS